jgi:hypothetical protein
VGCAHAACPSTSDIAKATKGKSQKDICTTSFWNKNLQHYSTDCCHTWDMCSTLSADCFTDGKAEGDADKSACATQCKKTFGDNFFKVNLSAFKDDGGLSWDDCTEIKDNLFPSGKGTPAANQLDSVKTCKATYGGNFFTLPQTTPSGIKNDVQLLKSGGGAYAPKNDKASCSVFQVNYTSPDKQSAQKRILAYRGCS